MINISKVNNQEIIDHIYSVLTTDIFAWYFNESQVTNDKEQHAGFTHVFYRGNEINSSFFDKVNELLNIILDQEQIKIKSIFRIQANLLPNINITDEQVFKSIHSDMAAHEGNYISVLYYVIDSDGDTVLFNNDQEIRVSPEKGKYIAFTSAIKHRASMPVINKRRIVINFVLEV